GGPKVIATHPQRGQYPARFPFAHACPFVVQAHASQRHNEETRRKSEGGLVARVDSTILREIVRVIQARSKVPERVRILKREYLIRYLEAHRQRLEEALRRHDTDRLSMLFGQLASKVKYHLIRRVASRERAVPARPAARRASSRNGRRKRVRSR